MEILKLLVAIAATCASSVESVRRLQAGSCCAFSPTNDACNDCETPAEAAECQVSPDDCKACATDNFVGEKAQHDPAWRRRAPSTVATMATRNFKISIMSLPAQGD